MAATSLYFAFPVYFLFSCLFLHLLLRLILVFLSGNRMFDFCKPHLQWEQGDSESFPAVDGTCSVLHLG